MKKFYFFLLIGSFLTGEAIAQVTTQIVGGDHTPIAEVPWQVPLGINGGDKCTGQILYTDYHENLRLG